MTDKQKIVNAILSITHPDKGKRFPVMSGNVVAGSYNSSANTVSVQLSVDDVETGTEGVNINVILNNAGGVYLVPTDGANCLVAEVDGPGKWELLKASSYDKIVIQAGTSIQFNDGSLGALPVLSKILDNLNALKNYVQAMNSALPNAFDAVGAGSAASGTAGGTYYSGQMAGQEINFEDMGNSKITQG